MKRFYLALLQFALLLIMHSSASQLLYAQTTPRDIVYLKNGSIVKGVIIEQIPNKSIKIETADGSVFVYDFADVEKIVKETTPAQQMIVSDLPTPRGQLSLLGGIAIPTSDFAATTGRTAGLAKTGYGFGAQYNSFLPSSIMWSISLSAAFNPVDETAARQALGISSSVSADISPWSSITPLVGFGFYVASNPDLLFYAEGQIGALFGSSPDMKFTSGSTTVTQSSASSSAFAYGFQAGATISGKVSLSAKYVTGQPKYKITASGGGYSASGEYEQPTAIFQFYAGIGF